MPFSEATEIVKLWARQGLENIRFSGGEPTLYPGLYDLVALSRGLGIKRVAISTNGSADQKVYERLVYLGANDFSISLDACCAEDNLKMTGGVRGAWDTVVSNIRYLATKTYVTIGVVLTDQNVSKVNDIIAFAAKLGVQDIRIIPAAQEGDSLQHVQVDECLLAEFPILAYRIRNIQEGRPVRGLRAGDSTRCGLALDDMAVNKGLHFPCIIYMREGGAPIGKVGEGMREERSQWSQSHDTHKDPICSKNCLDVCIEYNNEFARFQKIWR